MPKTVNGHAVMTSQEWMQLGYPVFVSAALEESNTAAAEEGDSFGFVTPETFKLMSAEEQLGFALEWNGIIGYTSYIYEAALQLDANEGAY
jgi:hypothetical protein